MTPAAPLDRSRPPRSPPAAPILIPAHARATVQPPLAPWGAEVKRILCVRLDHLGDVLMTTPALLALKTAVPARHLTLLASRAGAAIAPFIPKLDDLIEYDAPWLKHGTPPDPAADLRMRERLEAGRYDAAVIFTVYSQNPLPAAMLCYLAGIPRRLAFCRENPYAILNDWVGETEPHARVRHEVERQLALVGAVGARADDARMRVSPAPSDVLSLRAVLATAGMDPAHPLVVVHPGATAASRRYPASRFAQVAARLGAAHDRQIILTGGVDERALAHEVRSEALAYLPAAQARRVIDLSGRLTLGQLLALLQRAALLISNNSGPVHMAAALGVPVVDLYALTNPQHTPWLTPHAVLSHDVPCRWCYKSICPEGHHRCLTGVTVEQVVAAANALLAAGRISKARSARLLPVDATAGGTIAHSATVTATADEAATSDAAVNSAWRRAPW